MREHEVDVAVAACTSDHDAGWLRYLTGASAVEVPCVAVLARGDEVAVTYAADARDPLALVEAIATAAGPDARIGLLGTPAAVRRALDGRTGPVQDITAAAERARSVKSLAELEAIRATGRTVAQGLAAFEASARPGRPAALVASEVDEVLRGAGCVTGTVALAFDEAAIPTAPPHARAFSEHDVVVVSLTYLGPLGYWYEVSRVYSFAPLPADVDGRLSAFEHVYHDALFALEPGRTPAMVAAVVDALFAQRGHPVRARHAGDCHPIGTDDTPEHHGAPARALEANMTVAFHPGVSLDGQRGFHLAETFVVRPDGGVPMSPRGAVYRRLSA